MTMAIFAALLAVANVPSQGNAQGTSQFITFDGPPALAPGGRYNVTNYYESGMTFSPAPGAYAFTRAGAGQLSFFPDDGSDYVSGPGLMFSFTDGSLFSLISVDLAGYSTYVPDLDIEFIGYHPDGSTVTTEFTGSGINFQTYYFNGLGFSDLTRVEVPITPTGWSLDNLEVSLPEPSVSAIFLAGNLALFWQTRRRTNTGNAQP